MDPQHDRPRPDSTNQFLAAGALRGDAESFNALYDRIAPALHSWARLRIPPSLRALLCADDVVQEVWMRAFASFGGYDAEQGSFRRWIFGIARHALLKQMRGAGRRSGGEGYRSGAFDFGNLRDRATAVSLRVRRDEGVEKLVRSLDELPEEDRELILLRGLEGNSHQEVAAQLGTSDASVRKRWERLRKQLDALRPPAEFFA